MPSQSRKHRGYSSQRIVADYLAAHGWPYAESTGAGRQGADITGTPDIAVEVKARRSVNLKQTMEQAESNADGRLAFAVLRLDGQGPAVIEDWPVVIRFGAFVEVLRDAGWGDPR